MPEGAVGVVPVAVVHVVRIAARVDVVGVVREVLMVRVPAVGMVMEDGIGCPSV